MKTTIQCALLPLLLVGLCNCATAKTKSKHSAIQYGTTQAPTGKQVLYGRFVVTAVNGNRVVLRQLDAPEERSNTRIVLAYPPGILIPQLGTVINRQYGGGFAIDQIAPSNDGQTSIYVTDMELQQN